MVLAHTKVGVSRRDSVRRLYDELVIGVALNNPEGSYSRDVRLLLVLRGLRGFGYGIVNTAMGLYLHSIGFSLLQVGLVVTMAGVASAVLIIAAGTLADRLGAKRPFLVLSSGLSIAFGLVFALTTSYPLLIAGAALGGAGRAGGGVPGGGPFGPVQQAMLADKSSPARRNTVFSLNALIGTIFFSLGAVTAGLPDVLASVGYDKLLVYKLTFLLFAAISAVMVILSLMVTEERKTVSAPKKESAPKSDGKLIAKFTMTATLNGFALGLIPLPLITLWFSMQYSVSDALISAMIGFSLFISAFPYLVAPYLARRLGAVRMIVLTRAFGVALLMILPLMPVFLLASAVYIVRGVLSSIGMPIRQSYMMGVVGEERRATAVGISSGVGWGIPYALSPVLSGYTMQEISLDLPIYVSALLQFANTAVYYAFFRSLRPPEESSARSPDHFELGNS